MPLPKYSGKHIVGDDSSDESSPNPYRTVSLEDNVFEELSELSSSGESSSDGSSSDESSDSESTSWEEAPVVADEEMPNVEPIIVPEQEDDFPSMALNPLGQTQGSPINGNTARPILPKSVSIREDDLPGCSTTGYSQAVSDMQIPADNGTQKPSTQISENNKENDLPPIRQRRTMPASFEDPESIGARVSKRGRGSNGSVESIERAKPLEITSYFREVSARLVRERVGLFPFQEYCKISNRALEKAIARSKQGQGQGPK